MSDIVQDLRNLAAMPEHDRAADMFERAADEIERLRSGGCARDQGTTQYCAEAALFAAENERLRAALEEIGEIGRVAGQVPGPRNKLMEICDIARAALAQPAQKEVK